MVSLQLIRFYIYLSFFLFLLGKVRCRRNCGRAYGPDLEGYVLHGEDAEQGAWPWMAALLELNETTGEKSPICTGFLIDSRNVISAAHCIRKNQTSLYLVKVGHVNLDQADTYTIKHIAVHEGFRKDQFYDDIVLLTLSKDVVVKDFNPICLPPHGTLRNLTGKGATLAGWGATTPDGPMSMTLKQLEEVPVVSNEVCNEAYGGMKFQRGLPLGITSGMICAGFIDDPARDSCGGDSGGPLMINEQNRWYAVGVVAFGLKCGMTDFPGVYTRVSEYMIWINQKKRIAKAQIVHSLSFGLSGFINTQINLPGVSPSVTDCGCGNSSTGCTFKDDGTKECFCRPGFADKEGECTGCECGVHSTSCRFKLSEKECICRSGYFDQKGTCADRKATPVALDLDFKGRLILYFVFDGSGSLGGYSFQRGIEFAKTIVKTVGISENGARASAIIYSPVVNIQFFPLQYYSTERTLEALDDLSSTGVSAHSALGAIRTEIIPMTRRVLWRKVQKSIIFILTDGEMNLGMDQTEQTEAHLLRTAGAVIYCIGITNPGNQDFLYRIASEPKQGHVFILHRFSSLSYVIQAITKGEIDYSECGLGLEEQGRLAYEKRILGARLAPEPWPWMAGLYVFDKTKDNIELQCSSASIIRENFILIAANCLYTSWSRKGFESFPFRMVEANEVIVRVGVTLARSEAMQEFEVDKFLIPPYYGPMREGYDIAVLKLKRPIEFNAFVRPICLPPLTEIVNSTLYNPGEIAVAIGWGHSVGTLGKSGDVLEEVFLPVQPLQQCDMLNVIFTDHMLCAGIDQGDTGTCSGDRGGPLIQSQINKDGYIYWTLIGVSARGQRCDKKNSFEYFTHVQKLLQWIYKALQQ